MRYGYIAYSISVIVRTIGFLTTGFLVLIAEALHSITDVLVIIVLNLSSRISRKPADLHHPLGHGLASNIGSLIAGVSFISIISYELVKEGVYRFLTPSVSENQIVGIAFMLASLIPLLLVFITLRKDGDMPEVVAMRYELRNDMLSGLSAVLAISVSSIVPHADAVVSIAIGVIIAYSGFKLVLENARMLLGHSPDESFYRKIESVVTKFEEVRDVHDVIATYIGSNRLHVDMHVTVDGEMRVRDADQLTVRIMDSLLQSIPEIAYASIHVCAEGKERIRTTYHEVVGRDRD